MNPERKIPASEAAAIHNVVSDDGEMENGEFRFRRKKLTDGTAYIRTEAITRGGWQKSHFHEHMKETYIVQKGWIGYAEIVNGKGSLTIYRAGQVFTTRPKIIHNVYMPGGAVIHTVKHGEAPPNDLDDRKTNPGTERFTVETSALSEEHIQRWAMSAEKNEIYTAEYRHFDTLIWQVPTWSTAIFALTAVGASSIASATYLTEATKLSSGNLASGLFGLMFLVILVLSHAMHRFRKHQSGVQLYSRTPIWRSASTYFQLAVTGEAFILLLLVMLLNGVPLGPALGICVGAVALISAWREYSLRRQYANTGAI